MKRIALLVLALIANVSADEKKKIQEVAANLETDTQTVELCLSETGKTLEEINIGRLQLTEIKDEKDIDDEAKQSVMVYCSFIACIMEQTNMIKDTKIVVDKVLEMVDKEKAEMSKEIYNVESLSKCMISLNENDMTRDERSYGLMLCFVSAKKA